MQIKPKYLVIILIILIFIYLYNDLFPEKFTMPEQVRLYSYDNLWATYNIYSDTYLNYTFSHPITSININTTKYVALYGYTGTGDWALDNISAVPELLKGEIYNWKLLVDSRSQGYTYFTEYPAYLIVIK